MTNSVKKLRIYAILMRIHELQIEKQQNEYYKNESLAIMMKRPYIPEQLCFFNGKSGKELRRERRKQERKNKKG